MSTAVAVFEQQLKPLAPHFSQVLPANLPVERLMRTIVVSVERLPKLLECDRQSLFNAAMSAAVLGLEVDGVTGQAYLIPFKNRAQLVVGYKGYNTLAARAGITITGSVVRDGDVFEYDIGEGWVTHKPALNSKGRIIAAWAKAATNSRPSVVTVLGIDDLLAVKKKSPGASRSDSPWNDTDIGFPAMCEKTAKRRLARSLPLSVMQLASRLDEAVDEQGQPAWVSPDRGVIVEGEFTEAAPTPTFEQLTRPPQPPESRAASSAAPSVAVSQASAGGAAEVSKPRTDLIIPTSAQYVHTWGVIIDSATSATQLAKAWNENKAVRNEIEWFGTEREDLQQKVERAIEFLKRPARAGA